MGDDPQNLLEIIYVLLKMEMDTIRQIINNNKSLGLDFVMTLYNSYCRPRFIVKGYIKRSKKSCAIIIMQQKFIYQLIYCTKPSWPPFRQVESHENAINY